MKKQKVVRTYANDWVRSGKNIGYKDLEALLDEGYFIVASNPFQTKDGTQYIEYIVEVQDQESQT